MPIHSTPNRHYYIPRCLPNKGSPHKSKKKVKRAPKKAKKQLISMPSDSEDDSQLIVTQGTLEGHLAGGSEEDGHGGEGEEASQASHKRERPRATVTSGATLLEHEDEGQEKGPPPPKKSNISDSLSDAQEQTLMDFFAFNQMFYDQTLSEFKDKIK